MKFRLFLSTLALITGQICITAKGQAAIIHTDYTAAPITINATPSIYNLTINGSIFQFSQSYTSNLNNNGMMQIKAMTLGAAVASSGDLESLGQLPSTIPTNMLVADNLNISESIGSGASYTSQIQLLNHNEYDHYGNFIISQNQQGRKSGYIGVSMIDPVDGLTRYGWIQYTGVEFRTRDLPADWVYKSDGIISGFAYNTTPNEAIAAGAVPEPSSLAVLGLGTAGFLMRRRRPLPIFPILNH
jgi:hypothetical protein